MIPLQNELWRLMPCACTSSAYCSSSTPSMISFYAPQMFRSVKFPIRFFMLLSLLCVRSCLCLTFTRRPALSFFARNASLCSWQTRLFSSMHAPIPAICKSECHSARARSIARPLSLAGRLLLLWSLSTCRLFLSSSPYLCSGWTRPSCCSATLVRLCRLQFICDHRCNCSIRPSLMCAQAWQALSPSISWA